MMDPHQGNAYRGGERTPTTLGSIEDSGPPTVVADPVGFAVGTPAIPDADEDFPSEIQAPSAPTSRHSYGSDLSRKKQGHPLQLVTGELAPDAPRPGRYGERPEQGFGEQTGATPVNAPSSEARNELPLEKNQSPTETPPSSSNENSGGFFGKLTRTQWALVGAGVLIVVLIIVIVVVAVNGNSSGGGDGTPTAVPAPSGSPVLAPSGDLSKNSNAPQPAPSVVPSTGTVPPTNPTQAPNPRMPAETPDPTPRPIPSPTTEPPTLSPDTNQPTMFVGSQTIEGMMTRGVLLCGVTPGISGFSVLNGDTYEGFEADLVS